MMETDISCLYRMLSITHKGGKVNAIRLYIKKIYNFARDNWRSIVSRVFSGAEGDAVPYFFQISRTISNMKMKLADLNQESNRNDNVFYKRYENDLLNRIWDADSLLYDYN